ncbi:EAL domain-containing protein [Phyllobacterium sp. P5_D12]
MITPEAIQTGLDEGQFFLEYLPTILLKDRSCVGAEALIRWRRDGHIIPPLSFIPLIEDTTLGGVLTYWVMEKVAEELGDWLRQTNDVRISINVPPSLVGRGGIQYAARQAGVFDLDDKLILEITERGHLDSIGLNTIINRSGKRFLVAIDDIMLDQSNLLLLSRVPVDIIKLDKSVIDNADSPSMNAKLLTLRHLITDNDLTIIAEGVETASQASNLENFGIQMAQGYFFSRPLAATNFMEYHSRCRYLLT